MQQEIESDNSNRRSERRQASRRFEASWLFCTSRGVGGLATLRDLSSRGLSVTISRRSGKLLDALRDARDRQEPIEVLRRADGGQDRAIVAWMDGADPREVRVGLALMPVSDAAERRCG